MNITWWEALEYIESIPRIKLGSSQLEYTILDIKEEEEDKQKLYYLLIKQCDIMRISFGNFTIRITEREFKQEVYYIQLTYL